jgi:plasmid stabilization system protein ParE
MAQVRLSEGANLDLERIYKFLAKNDFNAADNAVREILGSFALLEQFPAASPLVLGRNDLRKLVIDFGAKGYVAFYEYDPLADTVIVATILHQLERYDEPTVGKEMR